jgi:hypothetical protein
MARQLTAQQLIDELQSLADPETKVYIANYQHRTPPEDKAIGLEVMYIEEEGEERIYIEARQTGRYLPGEVQDAFGW